MKISVFGGAGFLGSYVVDELIKCGHEVTVFDQKPSKFIGSNRVIIGDLMDPKAVSAAVKGHEVVYNFAGFSDLNQSIAQPVKTIELNVMGNLHVLEACREYKVNRFVYASSAYVFSRKGAFYGASKKCSELIIEEYTEQYGFDHTIIRYGSVYGERADVSNRIYRLLRQALTEGKIIFAGDGSEEREYIHGRDAAKLSVEILKPNFRNQHVILTGIERHKYSDLLRLINEIMGNKLKIELQHQDYRGHYAQTPYSFAPTVGVKLINNPCVDFGQGLLECIETLYGELHMEGTIEHHPTHEIKHKP